jgi:uncharacterized protein
MIVDKQEIMKIIHEQKAYLSRKYALTRIGVFGSVARGAGSEAGDIDIVVVMKPDLLKRAALREELEEILHARVDVVRYSERMNRTLKHRIDSEALYV